MRKESASSNNITVVRLFVIARLDGACSSNSGCCKNIIPIFSNTSKFICECLERKDKSSFTMGVLFLAAKFLYFQSTVFIASLLSSHFQIHPTVH